MRCHRGCAGAQVWGDTVTEGIEVDARHGDRERAVLRAAVREWSALRRHRPSRAQTRANADSSIRDDMVPENGQEPIAERKPEIQVHTRPLPENHPHQRLRQALAAAPLSAAAEGPRWRGRASASSGYDWRPDFRRLVPSLRSSWRFSSGFTPYEWTPVNAERARVHSRCRNRDGRVHDAVLVEQQRCFSASTAAAVALLPPLPWRHFVRPLGLPRRPGTKSKRLPVRESFAPDRWDMCSTSCAANVPGRRRGQGCACCGRLARPGPVGNMSCPYTSALT